MEEGFRPGPGQGAQSWREDPKVRAGPAVLSPVKQPPGPRGRWLAWPEFLFSYLPIRWGQMVAPWSEGEGEDEVYGM